MSLSQRDIISSIDLFFSRDWAGLGADAEVAMAGAARLFESVAPAVVVVEVLPGAVGVIVDAVGLLPNSDPAPRDDVVVAVVVVLAEAGAVTVAGVLLKRFWVDAVDVVGAGVGAVVLSAPAAGAEPKIFEVVDVGAGVAAVLEVLNRFGVGAVVAVGVEATGAENKGFCVAVPAPPKTDGAVVAAVVGAVRVLLVSSQVQRALSLTGLGTSKDI